MLWHNYAERKKKKNLKKKRRDNINLQRYTLFCMSFAQQFGNEACSTANKNVNFIKYYKCTFRFRTHVAKIK